MKTRPGDRALLATMFVVSGTLHLLRPRPFEKIVPHALPYQRELVYASGALELACAAGLMVPFTRRVAGLFSAALLVGVFPANVQMAIDLVRSRRSLPVKIASLARLPLQWPLVRIGWRAFRDG